MSRMLGAARCLRALSGGPLRESLELPDGGRAAYELGRVRCPTLLLGAGAVDIVDDHERWRP